MNKIVTIKGSTNRYFLKEGKDFFFFSGVLIVDVLNGILNLVPWPGT